MVTWTCSHSPNQEAKRVRDIGSLVVDASLQHDSEAGVDVRSLLSTEMMEEVDGRFAVTNVDCNGQRYVKFWIDDSHNSPAEEQAAHHVAEEYATEGEPQQLPGLIPAFPVFCERSAESRVPRTPERRQADPSTKHWMPVRQSWIWCFCNSMRVN